MVVQYADSRLQENAHVLALSTAIKQQIHSLISAFREENAAKNAFLLEVMTELLFLLDSLGLYAVNHGSIYFLALLEKTKLRPKAPPSHNIATLSKLLAGIQ